MGGGGVGHTVVQGVGHPAGKILRQGVGLAPLLERVAAVLFAGEVAPHPVGQVGGDIPRLAPQSDGPAREVAQEIGQRHGAVHGAVAVCSGVIQ